MTIKRLGNGTYDVGGGVTVPSVTTVLQVGNPRYQLGHTTDAEQFAMQRGSEVHDVIAHILAGYIVEDLDPIVAPFVAAWTAFREEMGFEATHYELPVYSARYGYAGTLDAIGLMRLANPKLRDRLGVFDWKTCSTFATTKAMGPQTAAYEQARFESSAAKCRRINRFIVMLRNDGQFRVVPMKDRNDFNTFLSCKNVWEWINK